MEKDKDRKPEEGSYFHLLYKSAVSLANSALAKSRQLADRLNDLSSDGGSSAPKRDDDDQGVKGKKKCPPKSFVVVLWDRLKQEKNRRAALKEKEEQAKAAAAAALAAKEATQKPRVETAEPPKPQKPPKSPKPPKACPKASPKAEDPPVVAPAPPVPRSYAPCCYIKEQNPLAPACCETRRFDVDVDEDGLPCPPRGYPQQPRAPTCGCGSCRSSGFHGRCYDQRSAYVQPPQFEKA